MTTTKKKFTDTIRPLIIPAAGVLVTGVLAFSAYSVDQAMHQRDFTDLVEEVEEMDNEFETAMKDLVDSLERSIAALKAENSDDFGAIIDLQNATRDIQTDILLIQRDMDKTLRVFTGSNGP